MDQDPLVRVRLDLTPPDGRDFWTDPQPEGDKPTFTTQEAAKVFFGRGKLWLQLRLIGKEADIAPRSPAGYRQFQLHHIELIAHHFLEHGIIDINRFTNCIHVIRAIGRNYRLIER